MFQWETVTWMTNLSCYQAMSRTVSLRKWRHFNMELISDSLSCQHYSHLPEAHFRCGFKSVLQIFRFWVAWAAATHLPNPRVTATLAVSCLCQALGVDWSTPRWSEEPDQRQTNGGKSTLTSLAPLHFHLSGRTNVCRPHRRSSLQCLSQVSFVYHFWGLGLVLSHSHSIWEVSHFEDPPPRAS